MWDPYAEFQSTKLDNGLTIFSTQWPNKPWQYVGLLIHSGASSDREGLEGTAHFVEHLIASNGPLSENEMQLFFDECGGYVNWGRTGYPYTHYLFCVPADEDLLNKAFGFFGNMLLAAKLRNEIESQREIIIQEFRQDYPANFKYELAVREYQSMYPQHWLSRFTTPLGNLDSLGKITPNDLQTYYDKHYVPANISVISVGGMALKDLTSLIAKSPLAADKPGLRNPLPVRFTDVAKPTESRYVFDASKHIKDPNLATCSYYTVAKIPASINVRVVRLLRDMLNEILYREVRQKRNWTYSISCDYGDLGNFYVFSINCGFLDLGALNEIDQVVEACLSSLTSSHELFYKMKKAWLTGNLMIDVSGQGLLNDALDDLIGYHRIVSISEVNREIENVTMDDIVETLSWLTTERRWTLITKP